MRRPVRRRRRGMSLVEVMISSSIAALLLTASSAAWRASANAVDQNDQVFRAVQAMRVSILQMTNEIRRCMAVQVYADHVDLIPAENPTHIYTFEFSPATQQMLMIDNDGVNTPTQHVLANDVTAGAFAADTAPNPLTQILCVVRVTVKVTTQVGANAVTVSGAASPRVNINY